MIKIGEFARLSQVTVKTLHHYDELGLLKPVFVDQCTGYRHYAIEQLARLNRLLALKDLGLTLEQIGLVLRDAVSAAELRGMLRLKQAEAQQQVAQEQARLARIAARLRSIEQEERMPAYDVVVKKTEPMLVASVRMVVSAMEDVGQPWMPLYAHLAHYGVVKSMPNLILWHDNKDIQGIDCENAAPLREPVPESGPVHVHTLPGFETTACVVHQGGYDTIVQAYQSLYAWVEANGYRIIAATRQVHLAYSDDADPSTYITELQFPVAKA